MECSCDLRPSFYLYCATTHTRFFFTPPDTRFLLLHDPRTEDASVRSFFFETHDAYVKCMLNPFQEFGTPLTNAHILQKVRDIGNKYYISK